MRKSPRKQQLRKLTRFALLSCLFQCGVVAPLALGQDGRYTTFAPKITENSEKSSAGREKTAEVKSASGSTAAITKFYRDYAIPTITLAQPTNQRIFELTSIRRTFEDDLDSLSRAPKSFRAAYNKVLLTELEKVIKEPNCHPSARVICFGMAMQLYTEPASAQGPALPSRSLLPLIAAALRPEEKMDASQLLALDAVERFLLTKSTQADEILTEAAKAQLCTRIAALLTMEGPPHRVAKTHQYILERALRTLTTMAIVGQSNANTAKDASTKNATEAVAKFVKIAIQDSRSTEWLKEGCCVSIGSLNYPEGTFTPEEALLIQQEVAKFSIKSMKDWLNKVARSGGSGSGMGGYGSGYGSGMADSSMMSSSEMSGPGYGMSGFGNSPANQSNVSKQPTEVKNARRMLNQRLERLHLAFYGTPVGDDKKVSENPAKRGIASFAPASEKYNLEHTIEKLREVQKSLNEDKILDLSSLTGYTNQPIREFGAACFEISGDRARAMEEEQDLQMSFFGAAPQPSGDEGANGEGAPEANGQQPGGPAAGGNQPARQPQPAGRAPVPPGGAAAPGANNPAANGAGANPAAGRAPAQAPQPAR